MLEYFTIKKLKKRQAEKAQAQKGKGHADTAALSEAQTPFSPILPDAEQQYLERIVSEDHSSPSAPHGDTEQVILTTDDPNSSNVHIYPRSSLTKARSPTDETEDIILSTTDPANSTAHVEKALGAEDVAAAEAAGVQKKGKRMLFLRGTFSKKTKPPPAMIAAEIESEEHDLTAILDKLSLTATNNRAFSLSPASLELVQKFTLILKDLVNGVPTAYDDLTSLLDTSQEQLQHTFASLPSSLQKLVRTLPTKLTSTLAPELLAAATEAQGVAGAGGSLLSVPSLKALVTKPGAVAGLLKGVMNVLKLRWPAFVGTNVLWSLGLFGESHCPLYLSDVGTKGD
ncbi:MAG: hypothetical protein M1829_003222 [Trizodia sp. TS-e1964]|nr:MAG: hypothetical protein M1829_003222 [Trizodia sp. TS-e1964]